MHSHLKIGIIQNAPQTADFPGNLRSIVQGYRYCIDHGAELVIAPACALCGINPGSLASRKSFLLQTQAALDALSHELNDCPLLLGAYTALFPEDDCSLVSCDGEDFDELAEETCSDITPFIIGKNSVTELTDAATTIINGRRIYVDINIGESLPDDTNYDLFIHLGGGSWHSESAQEEDETRSWEARNNDVTVVCAHPVGTAGGHIYAGGSTVYNPEGTPILRLPFFESASRVADVATSAHARPLPQPDEMLEQALIRGIHDSVHSNGYSAVCIPLDHPNAPLLAALCTDAIGASHVYGVTFGNNRHSCLNKLGIKIQEIDAAPVLAAASASADSPLAARLQAALLTSYADDQGLMLLCPLSRPEAMLGAFTLYGESCGLLAPLGNLYRTDLHMLAQLASERHPGITCDLSSPCQAEQDHIIHEMTDRNTAPSDLLASFPQFFQENDVRYVQRRIIASALKRTQLPDILHVDDPAEQLEFPVCHKLND